MNYEVKAEKKQKKKEAKPQVTTGRKHYYALQRGKTDDNKKRRMIKHCKNHPNDFANADRVAQRYKGARIEYSGLGRRRIRRANTIMRLRDDYRSQVSLKIAQLQQHNASQQQVQGPLYSEYGFRIELQTIRHSFNKRVKQALA